MNLAPAVARRAEVIPHERRRKADDVFR